MKKYYVLIGLLTLLLFGWGKVYGQTPIPLENDPYWEEIWEYDFTLQGVNEWALEVHEGWTNKLTFNGTRHGLVSNLSQKRSEPQLYRKENVTFTDEGIQLRAKYDPYFCEFCTNVQYHNFHYSSGCLNLHEEIHYGYLEAEIKMSNIYGTFPAFWLVKEVGSFEDNDGDGIDDNLDFDYDEIDIFEMAPGSKSEAECDDFIHGNNTMTTTIHADKNSACAAYLKEHECHDVPNGIDVFNTYGVEWTPEKIRWYLNGDLIRESDNPQGRLSLVTSITINQALYKWVSYYHPDHPYHHSTNTGASHGIFTEHSDKEYFTPPATYTDNQNSINTTNSDMIIKNVKYYKLNNTDCNNGSLIVNSQATFATNFINPSSPSVKETITINEGTISSTESVIMRASESVTIEKDFNMEVGGKLKIIPSPCY